VGGSEERQRFMTEGGKKCSSPALNEDHIHLRGLEKATSPTVRKRRQEEGRVQRKKARGAVASLGRKMVCNPEEREQLGKSGRVNACRVRKTHKSRRGKRKKIDDDAS